MENNQNLLSICIPTYNRDYLVQECLGKLCPLAQKHNIKIYISDNASVDNTENIIAYFQKKFPNTIIYKKQDVNIGPDQNFEYVLKMTNSIYRWLLSDSSYIEENSLCLLLEELQDKKHVLYVINDARKERLTDKVPTIYINPNELLEDIGWHLTWISALVYHEKIIENANFIRYYNSRFIQTGIIFEYFISHACSVRINPNIYVKVFDLPKKGHWINIAFEVFAKDWYLFVMSLPINYSYEAKYSCIRKHGSNAKLFTFRGLLFLRREGILDIYTFFKYRFFIKQTIEINSLIVFFISLFPKFFICIFFKTYHLFKSLFILFG